MSYLPENVNHYDQVLALLERSDYPIAVTPKSQGGLVLVNQHYSDFIGPGSRLVWPAHFQCKGIYAVGEVQLCTLHAAPARQNSLHNRVMGLAILARILKDFDPKHRACLLVNLLCNRLGLKTVRQADLTLLGSLGRVSLEQMHWAIGVYEQDLQKLGKTEGLGDRYRVSWQRQGLALSERDWLAPNLAQPTQFEAATASTAEIRTPEQQYELVHL